MRRNMVSDAALQQKEEELLEKIRQLKEALSDPAIPQAVRDAIIARLQQAKIQSRIDLKCLMEESEKKEKNGHV